MAELDFMVVADYVRTDAGVLQMIGAGFDTVQLPAVAGLLTAGIGLRILLDVAEAADPHPFALIFRTADGARLAEVTGVIGPVVGDAPKPAPGRPYSDGSTRGIFQVMGKSRGCIFLRGVNLL